MDGSNNLTMTIGSALVSAGLIYGGELIISSYTTFSNGGDVGFLSIPESPTTMDNIILAYFTYKTLVDSSDASLDSSYYLPIAAAVTTAAGSYLFHMLKE